ncbi:site-specific integrase [Fictibacillus enclensis]|uniref:tyrosine-type recombinase/integrase n=1 Tax=Fictibacillus enclensis TaxID=1017270 RepID=UPI0025A0C61F|nr:site-specific integrase [Fictibacillus enclensis]MDM5338512.1 site-specific integrase [Fictibacillus enclensis]
MDKYIYTTNGKISKNLSENDSSTKQFSAEDLLDELFCINWNPRRENNEHHLKELINQLSALLKLDFPLTQNIEKRTLTEWIIQNDVRPLPKVGREYLLEYKHLNTGTYRKLIKAVLIVLERASKKLRKPILEITFKDLEDPLLFQSITNNTAIHHYLSVFYKRMNPFTMAELKINNTKKTKFNHEMIKKLETALRKEGWQENSIKTHLTDPVKWFFSWLLNNYVEFDMYLLNNFPAWKIKETHLKEFRSYLMGLVREGELTKNYVSENFKYLKLFFSLSYKLGYRINHMNRIIGIPSEELDSRRIPQNEELQHFFDTVHMYSENYQEEILAYQFMLFLGLRISEVIQLKWKDINLEDPSIIIKGKGGVYSKMPLPAPIIERLQIFSGKQKEGYVLSDNPQKFKANLKNNHKLYCEIAGTEYFRGFHIFRHTFVTKLTEVPNCSPKALRLLARHNSLVTTSNYYHATDEQLETSINKLKY